MTPIYLAFRAHIKNSASLVAVYNIALRLNLLSLPPVVLRPFPTLSHAIVWLGIHHRRSPQKLVSGGQVFALMTSTGGYPSNYSGQRSKRISIHEILPHTVNSLFHNRTTFILFISRERIDSALLMEHSLSQRDLNISTPTMEESHAIPGMDKRRTHQTCRQNTTRNKFAAVSVEERLIQLRQEAELGFSFDEDSLPQRTTSSDVCTRKARKSVSFAKHPTIIPSVRFARKAEYIEP